MDPDACLALLLDACRDEDRDAAFGALSDLLMWLAKGGGLPADPRSKGTRIHSLGATVTKVPTFAELSTLVPRIARLWAEVHEADPALAFELAWKLPTMKIVRKDEDTP